jgi:hypothetical protein
MFVPLDSLNSHGISLQPLDDMFDFDLAVISFYSPILRPAQKDEFWIPTGREPLNIFYGGSFQLSKLLVEFHHGHWMICRL